MKRWFMKASLAQKILCIPLVTVLLMGLGLMTAGTVAVQNSYENKVSQIIEQTVTETSRYVSAELRNLVALVHFSLLDQSLQAALLTDLDGDLAKYIQAQDVIISMLASLKSQSTYIESVALTVQGKVFTDDLHEVSYDMTPLLQAAQESQLAYWTDTAITNESTGKTVLPMVMRVPTGSFSETREAYILVNLDAQELFGHIHRLEQSLGCALVLHSGDNVLYGDEQFPRAFDDTAYVVNDTELEISGWSLCCVMERSRLYASRNESLANMLVASAAISVVCLLLSYFVAQSILRPLRSLTLTTERVARGDYSARTGVTGADELGLLGRTLNDMTRQIQQNIAALEEKNRQISLSEQKKRLAEMKVLQAQINPHFLYNTLDSVYWYALSGRQRDIGMIVEKLSDMLRIGLSKGSEYIPLSQELRHVQDYLGIQKIIFSDKIDYEIRCNVPDEYLVVKVLLQPLVENSINHGFENMERGGMIWISVDADEHYLHLKVADNGCGFALSESQQGRSPYAGFALKNIEERLSAHYGLAAELLIQSEAYQKTEIEIRIRKELCGMKPGNEAMK